MLNRLFYSTVLSLCIVSSASAFSPASNEDSSEAGPIAYAALITSGMEKELAGILDELDVKKYKAFENHNIHKLRFFTEVVGKKIVILSTYDTPKGIDPRECWMNVHKDVALGPWLDKMNQCISAHPRNAGSDDKWVRCETICKIRPQVPASAISAKDIPPTWHAAITGLKKEKEAEYRTLHQTVWPGVIDAIGNAGVPRFDIFLTELDDQVFIFYLFKHTGKDFKTQMAGIAKDPATLRWWSFTDACQQPLPSAAKRKEMWEPMESVKSLND